MRRGFSVGAILLLCGGALSSTVSAQSGQKRETPVFGSNITLVAIPVFVTDKNGRGIGGLTKDDFEVEDAGKKVPIVAFQSIEATDELPVFEDEREAEAQVPLVVRAAAPRQFILLFDMTFSSPGGLRYSRRAAQRFIHDVLAPRDLVAVAASMRGGLKVVTNLTTDHEFVARAIENLSSTGVLNSDALGISDSGVESGGGGNASIGDEAIADLNAGAAAAMKEFNSQRALAFVDDVEALAKRLAPVRGRKQIVLFSSGFPESLWATNISPQSRPEILSSKMNEMFKVAGQSDVLIHTIDVSGIPEAVDLSSQGGKLATLDSAGVPPVQNSFNRESGEGTLKALALSTGGVAIRRTNDFGTALKEVDQISRHSYVIAFEASDAGKADKPRRVKVRVKSPALTVSYRPEYVLSRPKMSADDAVRLAAAEAITKGLSGGPIGLHLATLPYHGADGREVVHAVLQMEGGSLAQAANGKDLAVQIYAYLMTGGRVVDTQTMNTSLDFAKFGESLKTNGLRVLLAFPAAPGPMDVRVFVRAGSEGLTGSTQRSVTVPAFVGDRTVLSSPIFTTPSAGKLVVPFQPANRPRIDIPFRVGNERMIPDASPTLVPGRAQELCVFATPPRSGGAKAFEVSGELVREGEAPKPLRIDSVRMTPDADGFDRYIATVTAPSAEPGFYRLRLTFVQPGTRVELTTDTGVLVAK